MDHDHGVATHDGCADEFDSGRRARWHAKVWARSADVALAAVPVPLRVLDVGCGAGAVLRELAERLPNVLEMVGADPSDGMLAMAREDSPAQIRFVRAGAESLPFEEGRFDLVVSTLSYHHWTMQPAGLAEVRRVLVPEGSFVLVDLSARWIRRRGPRADVRNPGEIVEALRRAGLQLTRKETVKRHLGFPFVRAFIASR
jgi:ubiquinone/menaquinone biosynthesis C-methylase UbiE